MKHCPSCNSKRHGDACWKCGTPTIIPHPSWHYPEMPSVDEIRRLAKTAGYAIAVHGSLERDLDIIAAPWVDEAVSAAELLDVIAAGMNGRVAFPEKKPLGRIAANIQIDGWFMTIDISVMPRA